METLVLNRDGRPLSLLPMSAISWEVAVRLMVLEKVSVLHSYEDWVVRSPSIELKVPSVVITRDYLKWNRVVKYNRSNIFLRDGFTCQLCGKKPDANELTLDHVVPRSKGGKTNWQNITTCCKDCNERKGNDEKIRPKILPYMPSYYEMIAKRQQYPLKIKDRSWLNYIDWPEDMIELQIPKRK